MSDLTIAACETCPFKDTKHPRFIKAMLKLNYTENFMGCRELFPKWKPGLCHKGDRACAGYQN
jgi:hypothetical protein